MRIPRRPPRNLEYIPTRVAIFATKINDTDFIVYDDGAINKLFVEQQRLDMIKKGTLPDEPKSKYSYAGMPTASGGGDANANEDVYDAATSLLSYASR